MGKKLLAKDSLGNRMKGYENCSRLFLPRRSYTIIRIDGKAFHSYTKGCDRPFDIGLIEDMDETAKYLCNKIQGTKLAFVQSDEISILLTDFENINTSAWFDNNLQKICSVSASMTTSKFNQLRMKRTIEREFDPNFHITNQSRFLVSIDKLAEFDSRVFQIPQKTDVINYFIWRQQDTTRNSISSVAQSLYSHSQLNNKTCNEMQEMIFQKGINWNDYDNKLKRGRLIIKEIKTYSAPGTQVYQRTKWESIAPPIFTQDWEYLNLLIPDNH